MELSASFHNLIVPLSAAFCCGLILGLERELAHKPAGLRTQVLISIGTTMFVLAGQLMGGESARISANVITGLGFLGAGVVLQHQGTVRGMTTASLIWANGSLGLAIGLREYELAGIGVVFVLVALRVLSWVEKMMKSKCHIVHYSVKSRESEQVLGVINDALQQCHFQEAPLTFAKETDGLYYRFAFCNSPVRHKEFIEKLRELPETIAVEIDS